MIKGLIALFTSGILINPLAWAGIGLGLYLMYNYSLPEIHGLAMNWHYHAYIILFTAVYSLIFKRVYHAGSEGVKIKANIKGIFNRYLYIIFITVVTCFCFVGYKIAINDETLQQIRNNKNVKILSNEAQSAYEAPKLPNEQ